MLLQRNLQNALGNNTTKYDFFSYCIFSSHGQMSIVGEYEFTYSISTCSILWKILNSLIEPFNLRIKHASIQLNSKLVKYEIEGCDDDIMEYHQQDMPLKTNVFLQEQIL